MLFVYLPVMLFEAFLELHTPPRDAAMTARKTTDEV
jgi:hypothetical protein